MNSLTPVPTNYSVMICTKEYEQMLIDYLAVGLLRGDDRGAMRRSLLDACARQDLANRLSRHDRDAG